MKLFAFVRNWKRDQTILSSQRGVALITALLISMVALAMVLMVIYFVTQGTQLSGLYKRYQTALEAAYGGADLISRQVIPRSITLADSSSPTFPNIPSLSTLGTYGGLIQATAADNCFNQKLRRTSNPLSNWSNCNTATLLDPSVSPDITIQLAGPAQATYNVFIKIVETKPGNSNTSGLALEGQGVAESGSGIITAPHQPMLYRIEVRAERQNAPEERAELSILYEY